MGYPFDSSSPKILRWLDASPEKWLSESTPCCAVGAAERTDVGVTKALMKRLSLYNHKLSRR